MPRLSLLRFLSLAPLIFLTLISLWLFLPSPTIPVHQRSHHIHSTLHPLSPLITVHPLSKTFLYGTHLTNSETDYLAITYQLSRSTRHNHDHVTLLVDSVSINLTHYALQPAPYLSDAWPGIKPDVRAGATDHVLNMPWFHTPDAVLFHHRMHGFSLQIALRVLVPEAGVVEVWKDSKVWETWEWSGLDVRAISEAEREVGMLLRLKGVPTVDGGRGEVGGIVVEVVKGELMSTSFCLRWRLLAVVAPLVIVLLFLVGLLVVPVLRGVLPLVGALVVVYGVVVGVVWLVAGKVRRESVVMWPVDWVLRRVGMGEKRKKRKRIWGATGPVKEDEERSGHGNHEDEKSFSTRLDEMLKGVRSRPRSVDMEGGKGGRGGERYG